MEIVTAWVKPPIQIRGLDHLGVQAPCINIYGRLLPGITNVTDRARYYSFYPWLIWALEQAGYGKYDDQFVEAFRKADGLFTLIAHRHASVSHDDHDNHAAATVGSANLSEHIAAIARGEFIQLISYAHRETNKPQYFKNKLGGLGQYYLGVLAELSILDGSSASGIRYTSQFGLPLAKSFDAGVPRNLFIKTIKDGRVNAQRLDELKAFCPCQLMSSSDEHHRLLDLFFAQNTFDDIEAKPRRSTLRLLLDLSEQLASKSLPLNSEHFRGCVYAGAMPDGTPWALDDELNSIRKLWAIYQRNELLSIGIQGLFYALLDAYQDSGIVLESGKAVAEWYVHESGELDELQSDFDFNLSFSNLVRECNDRIPKYECWSDDNHEVMLAEKIVLLSGQNKSQLNRTSIVKAAFQLLMILSEREQTKCIYESIAFPGNYFHAYPINLSSLLKESHLTWSALKPNDLLVWLFSKWGIDAHLRVALRKLRGQSMSTFRIRPTDFGLEVIDIPPAVHTSPRFKQAIRVLRDLGLLQVEGGITKCTKLAQPYR